MCLGFPTEENSKAQQISLASGEFIGRKRIGHSQNGVSGRLGVPNNKFPSPSPLPLTKEGWLGLGNLSFLK